MIAVVERTGLVSESVVEEDAAEVVELGEDEEAPAIEMRNVGSEEESALAKPDELPLLLRLDRLDDDDDEAVLSLPKFSNGRPPVNGERIPFSKFNLALMRV